MHFADNGEYAERIELQMEVLLTGPTGENLKNRSAYLKDKLLIVL